MIIDIIIIINFRFIIVINLEANNLNLIVIILKFIN
jgi:hypothetical protein